MMQARLLLTAGLTLKLALVSCSSNPATPMVPQGYPLGESLRWTYLVRDAATESTDTVFVQAPTIRLNASSVERAWVVTLKQEIFPLDESFLRPGTSIAYARGDSLLVHSILGVISIDPYYMLVFPLEIGRHWRTPYTPRDVHSDTTGVTARETIETRAGTFPGATRLERLITWEDCGLDITYWFVEGYGIVHCESVVLGNTCYGTGQTWDLIALEQL